MTCTHHCQRDTANPIPCHTEGGCTTNHTTSCAICNKPLRQQEAHTCQPCHTRINQALNEILDLALQAHAQTEPVITLGTGRTSLGSKPPITIDAIDPELTLVRLNENDPSSDTPILEILEDWERTIREERHLTPYGIASEARLANIGPLHGATWANHTPITLTGVIQFLRTQTPWVCSHQDINVKQYAQHLQLCVSALKRWSLDNQGPRWLIPCPTLNEKGDCGNKLFISRDDETTYCRQCARTWEVKRLIRVAGRNADVWVDIEAAATLAGVTERTIRNWVKAKHVAKRGQLVRVLDIRNHADTMTASA